ncbi:MAG: ATP citrate lyase citrate-binding domain-containing protein [Planctomycetota bacterium]
MAVKITELTFLQHLASRFHLPTPEFLTAEASGAQIRDAINKWSGKAIVKPDVLSGKRGKAGLVQSVSNYVEAQNNLKHVQSIKVNGQLPRTAYLVQYIPSDTDIYTAITYDSRFLGPAMTISFYGGVDVEDIENDKKATFPIDIYQGLSAYQASEVLYTLSCPKKLVSPFSRALVDLWDTYACDFKAVFDESNFKFKNLGFDLPEYPANQTPFEEQMALWSAASYRGQAHVAELGGDYILPILFGGGASTIIIETLVQNGGRPIFLSDFGGNPPYERMFGTAKICFDHHLKKAALILILGGKANNTSISVTFEAIANALQAYVDHNGPINIPVVVGRGGPQLIKGLLTLKDTLEALGLPYVIFGPNTPVTLVAEYAAKVVRASQDKKGSK